MTMKRAGTGATLGLCGLAVPDTKQISNRPLQPSGGELATEQGGEACSGGAEHQGR